MTKVPKKKVVHIVSPFTNRNHAITWCGRTVTSKTVTGDYKTATCKECEHARTSRETDIEPDPLVKPVVADLIARVREVYNETPRKIDAVRYIKEVTGRTLEEARDFFIYVFGNDLVSAKELAKYWCEEHWHMLDDGVIEDVATSCSDCLAERYAEAIIRDEQTTHDQELAAKKARKETVGAIDHDEEAEHRSKNCVLAQIFGGDFPNIVAKMLKTTEGALELQRKIGEWSKHRDELQFSIVLDGNLPSDGAVPEDISFDLKAIEEGE